MARKSLSCLVLSTILSLAMSRATDWTLLKVWEKFQAKAIDRTEKLA
jgi:hypothetical protein